MTPEEFKNLKAGDELFTCGASASGARLVIHRLYVQRRDGDCATVGDSMHHTTETTTLALGRGDFAAYFLSKKAAFDAYVKRRVRQIGEDVAEALDKAQRRVKQLHDERERILTSRIDDMMFIAYPSDFID